jgi:predicted PurR-regulated permease PerM
VAALTSALLRLDYLPVTTAASGVLMAIPFFGPFVAWAPPVIVALLVPGGPLLPAAVLMGIGWLIVMNALQPRLMQEAVGIHPIVVLGSVLIGSKIAGVTGAIFGIPIAAVLSAFFFHYLVLTREPAPVTARAARRVEEREGRKVRIPSEPVPGIDPDVTG